MNNGLDPFYIKNQNPIMQLPDVDSIPIVRLSLDGAVPMFTDRGGGDVAVSNKTNNVNGGEGDDEEEDGDTQLNTSKSGFAKVSTTDPDMFQSSKKPKKKYAVVRDAELPQGATTLPIAHPSSSSSSSSTAFKGTGVVDADTLAIMSVDLSTENEDFFKGRKSVIQQQQQIGMGMKEELAVGEKKLKKKQGKKNAGVQEQLITVGSDGIVMQAATKPKKKKKKQVMIAGGDEEVVAAVKKTKKKKAALLALGPESVGGVRVLETSDGQSPMVYESLDDESTARATAALPEFPLLPSRLKPLHQDESFSLVNI